MFTPEPLHPEAQIIDKSTPAESKNPKKQKQEENSYSNKSRFWFWRRTKPKIATDPKKSKVPENPKQPLPPQKAVKISNKIEDWVVVETPKSPQKEEKIDKFISDNFKILGER